ncbi:MAG: hypothetical protein ABWY57_15910 [Mycetocola sp.]
MSAQGGNANAVNGASDAKFGINPFETAKDEYTPTDNMVRASYVATGLVTRIDRAQSDQEFDRWLAAHDADLTAAHRMELARVRVEAFTTESDTFRERINDLTARLAAAEATITEVRKWSVMCADYMDDDESIELDRILSAYRPVAAHPEVESND